jgi:hypothetical protein
MVFVNKIAYRTGSNSKFTNICFDTIWVCSKLRMHEGLQDRRAHFWLNAYTSWLFLNIPRDHFRTIKYTDPSPPKCKRWSEGTTLTEISGTHSGPFTTRFRVLSFGVNLHRLEDFWWKYHILSTIILVGYFILRVYILDGPINKDLQC